MMRAHPAGDTGLLIDTDQPPAGLAAAIAEASLPGVIDIVPGARTVLVISSPGDGLPPAELAARIAALPVHARARAAPDVIEVPVVYDGPDLADVAELTGLSVAEVIAAHAGGDYAVGWIGFSPGFGYLTGLDPRLATVPRLATPRLEVPAGSVAIAAGLAAVYPAASPGGWRILGHTALRLWDADRDPAALLSPGRAVRFTAVPATRSGTPGQVNPTISKEPPGSTSPKATQSEQTPPEQAQPEQAQPEQAQPEQAQPEQAQPEQAQPEQAQPEQAQPEQAQPEPNPATQTGPATHTEPGTSAPGPAGLGSAVAHIDVIRPGPLATVQDLGRPGRAAIGVPPSGAADPASLIAANRLVGNPDGAAGIELTLGRAAFRFTGPATVAVAGAPAPVTATAVDPARTSGPPGFGLAFAVPPGAEVSIGSPHAGLRTYLAVAGGVATPAVLGSRSADLLSGIGGGPLRPGDRLAIGPAHPAAPRAHPGAHVPARGSVACLRVTGGPRLDWFAAGALDQLCSGVYTVSPASNRTGLRLDGPKLSRATDSELRSEGLVTGAMQVPPDGRPILLLADHPTTGGYPVIAVVVSADIPVAAQLRPGDQVSFSVSAEFPGAQPLMPR